MLFLSSDFDSPSPLSSLPLAAAWCEVIGGPALETRSSVEFVGQLPLRAGSTTVLAVVVHFFF